jgi:hypothetical protein
MEFFLDCWFPAIFITVWQLIFFFTGKFIIFTIKKLLDK